MSLNPFPAAEFVESYRAGTGVDSIDTSKVMVAKYFEQDGEIVGCVCVGWDNEIFGLLVSESHRGQGIARHLVERAILSDGDHLSCYDHNGLVKFYESLGFVETARYPFDPELANDSVVGRPDYVEMKLTF